MCSRVERPEAGRAARYVPVELVFCNLDEVSDGRVKAPHPAECLVTKFLRYTFPQEGNKIAVRVQAIW
jgi:hypothetical protein